MLFIFDVTESSLSPFAAQQVARAFAREQIIKKFLAKHEM
jgi:hypothetical protein